MSKDKEEKKALTREEKLKQAELASAAIDKVYGKGAIFSGDSKPLDVDVISTGNFAVDLAMGVFGLPRGRIAEIYGHEGVGKSLLVTTLIAECQAKGGLAVYVDAEHASDPYWMTKQGVNMQDLAISQPSSGEEALGIVRILVESGAYDLVVVDSVAALTPQAEINGDIGDSHVGLQARLMANAMRILNVNVEKTDTALVFVNQLRDKIGPMANGGSVTPGGRSLKFYASTRIDLRRIGTLTGNGEEIGFTVQAKIIKNKVAPPFKKVEYDVLHGMGFNNNATIIDYAVRYGYVGKSGNYYYLLDEDGNKAEKSFANGLAQASRYLYSDLEFARDLKAKITEEYIKRQGYFTFDEVEEEEIEEENEIGTDDE